jgi:uncharacterized protein YjbJ (UPF0337 family)
MSNYDQTQKTVAPAATQQAAVTPAQQPSDKGEKLHAEIKKNWSKLSDEEIRLYEKQPDQFFGKVKEKHGVSKEDAQKRLTEMKSSCGCGGTEKAA